MQPPFFIDIKEVTKYYKATIFVLLIAIINLVISIQFMNPTARIIFAILNLVIFYILARAEYAVSGKTLNSVIVGIFSMISLIGIIVIIYMIMKCRKIIQKNRISI